MRFFSFFFKVNESGQLSNSVQNKCALFRKVIDDLPKFKKYNFGIIEFALSNGTTFSEENSFYFQKFRIHCTVNLCSIK